MTDLNKEDIQYIYCAVCLECQDLKTPEMAITFVNGHAVCDDHRKRANYGFNSIVAGSRKYLSNGARTGFRSDRRES